MTRATIWPTSAQDLRFRGGFCQQNSRNDYVLGAKGRRSKAAHVSTCWNPEVLFSLRYGVRFRGLRFVGVAFPRSTFQRQLSSCVIIALTVVVGKVIRDLL